MKKTRFLVLALVAAVMMMGAGYAAWTEDVTISNNVQTGELSVALSNGIAVVNDDLTNREATVVADLADEANSAQVKVTNLYPGAHVDVTVPVTNDGTIPVKLDPLAPLSDDNTDPAVSVTLGSAPETLAVGETANITFSIDVTDDATENHTALFDVTTNYIQFNK